MTLLRVFYVLIVFSCISPVFATKVAFQKISSGKTDSLSSYIDQKKTSVSLAQLGASLGYKVKWDQNSQKLSCTKNASSIQIVQDVSIFVKNGNTFQIPVPPTRFGGGLYLPVKYAVEVFKSADYFLKWDSNSGRIQLGPPQYSVNSVQCEQKQNGNLLTIELGDSLPFDYTYFYPNLTLNFFGGTIDTDAVLSKEQCGNVKILRAVQFKQSAQVSVFLNKPIEEPIVDYIQDTKTIMVSLRPEKKSPVPVVIEQQPSLQEVMIKTIVLDPGHGGKDPGAIGFSGIQEKSVVLAITLELRSLLKKTGAFTTYMTRDKDVFIPLADRTKFANDKKADLFISVHANAISGTDKRKEETRGYKVYFLSQAKNDEDKLVAMRENAVIELEERPQNYSALQNVLIDLVGNEYLRESQDLCILLDQKLGPGLKKKIPKLQLGVGQANFWVLNGAFMPSVLIETGFISNAEEEKLLNDPKFQKTIAKSIFDAVMGMKKKYESGL